MALRARKPEAVTKRLKLFMFGPAGVGKTTAAIQFPNSYIIDCERGTENYDKLITDSGSAVFQTTDMHEVIAEVKSLLTEKHDYRTLVIDPITTIYNDLLEKCEAQVGTDFGRHYGAANKTMKRLANLIMALDMNVVVTAHAKTEYGENLAQARLHVRRLAAARLLVRPRRRAGQEGQEAVRQGREDAHRELPGRGRVRVELRRDQEAATTSTMLEKRGQRRAARDAASRCARSRTC